MSTPCFDGELKHENLGMVKFPNEKDGKVRVSLSFLSFLFFFSFTVEILTVSPCLIPNISKFFAQDNDFPAFWLVT